MVEECASGQVSKISLILLSLSLLFLANKKNKIILSDFKRSFYHEKVL